MVADLAATLRARAAALKRISPFHASGRITRVVGLLVESDGPPVSIGDLCEVESSTRERIRTQVVGFRDGRVLSMPLDEIDGLRMGLRIVARKEAARAPAGPELLGRVVDGFGRPLDGKGGLACHDAVELYAEPPGPMEREPIHKPLETGLRAIDGLLTCGKGQRVGIFGGSGVGKSTLLGAMARNSSADINVVALVGERNREVRAFLDEVLGGEGLEKSVVVVATSEKPAPVRVRASFLAAALADYFRRGGADVLLVMDSITRFAMAQREIGLTAGEPPSQKGYTPSVFQLLPKIFERAGNFARGSITGFYTVLVEGDDMNEPIADAARALLDGHITLSRELASANHFPAIDVLESVSRLAREISSPEHREAVSNLRDLMAAYRRTEDLIHLGAYASGSNPRVDTAIALREPLLEFLRQDASQAEPLESTVERLQTLSKRLPSESAGGTPAEGLRRSGSGG